MNHKILPSIINLIQDDFLGLSGIGVVTTTIINRIELTCYIQQEFGNMFNIHTLEEFTAYTQREQSLNTVITRVVPKTLEIVTEYE